MTTGDPAVESPPLWFIKLRAPFFTASLAPLLLGTAIAWALTGEFHFWYFLLTLVGGMFLQAGVNLTNDYFDSTWGSDDINTEFANPFTGGSRLIQNGILPPQVFLREGVGSFVIASLIGLLLTFTRGIGVLYLGIIGVFSGYFYTAPPFRLAGTGLGELLIGLNFGPLMVLGSYYVQTRAPAWEPVVAALPVGFLITLVVWINQFQDMRADAAVGKRNWVVRLGRRRAVTVYGVLLTLAYLSLLIGVPAGFIAPFALLGLLTIPLAVRAYRVVRVHYDHPQELIPANAATIQIHLLTALLITIGYVLQRLVSGG